MNIMLDFQQKRKLRSIAYSWVTVCILCIVSILALRSVWVVYTKYRESNTLRMQSYARLQELESRERELSDRIQRLDTDQGVEAEIRSKFDVAKKGEQVIVIVDDTVSTSTPPASHSIWSWIVNIFK